MHDTARPTTINELLNALRKEGRVPLGVVSYDVEREEFIIQMCPDVSESELRALLAKLRISFRITK